jgi:16S rRNA (cytosine1402-N4)-methyltransferase
MLTEMIESMHLGPSDIAVDCTVGAGGHTSAMLAAVGAQGRVIGLDRDETALAIASRRLADDVASGRLVLVRAPFSRVGEELERLGLTGKVAAIAADIGVSSMHLDEAERGFSFRADGPLDMRMDQSAGRTAADLVNELPEEELTQLFRDYGEEPKARNIARAIGRARANARIATTLELAQIVAKAAAWQTASRKHPATRVFQALRIVVNDELGELSAMLAGGFGALRPGGRLAVLTFHSLEDRVTKDFFQDLTGRKSMASVPRDLPMTADELTKAANVRGKILKPFPMSPSEQEIQENPRARSAKLRVVEKMN